MVRLPIMLGECGVPIFLPSLPGPLCPGDVAPDRVLSVGWIELKCIYAKLNCLNITVFYY